MSRHTPLHGRHRAAGAQLVDFAGWQMPLAYDSQIAEHHAVRRDAGVFDVSHMGIIDVIGRGALAYLRATLANDVARLERPGRALYTCLLNEAGGIVDDLIACFVSRDSYRLVVNASRVEADFAHLLREASAHAVELVRRHDLVLLAVQGPQARARTLTLLSAQSATRAAALRPFECAALDEGGGFIGRMGYTGEDGFELHLPVEQGVDLWDRLVAAGVPPCGLGARDTLRLEAGLALYGHEMDEHIHPYECGLGWTVAMGDGRAFTGRAALERILPGGPERVLTGLVLEERGVLRAQQTVAWGDEGRGVVTSGTYSPTLARSIALARVAADAPAELEVDVRGRWLRARRVPPRFVRHGKILTAL